jgi:hypothetical protein
MVGKSVWCAAAGILLLSTPFSWAQGSVSVRDRSTGQRYVVPYPNEVASLKAERQRLKGKERQLLASKKRCEKMRRDLDAELKAWQRQWDANERFGQQRSRGEVHRCNHRKYWDTRRRLERQDKPLKDRDAQLKQSARNIDTDLASVRESLRLNQERLNGLSGQPGTAGGQLIFDEKAKKTRPK